MSYGYHFPVSPLNEALGSKLDGDEALRPIVLVVDDEKLIVDTLSAILFRAGFTVLTAYDGASALEIAKVIPPDLLISDVAMPGMNGITLAVSVVCAIPDCRVLLFSAHAQSRDLDDARKAGFDFPLLAKPVPPRSMLESIHKCLASSSSMSSGAARQQAAGLQLAS